MSPGLKNSVNQWSGLWWLTAVPSPPKSEKCFHELEDNEYRQTPPRCDKDANACSKASERNRPLWESDKGPTANNLASRRDIRALECQIRGTKLKQSGPMVLPYCNAEANSADSLRNWLCHTRDGSIGRRAEQHECRIFECHWTAQACANVQGFHELHARECCKRNITTGYQVQLQVERRLCRRQYKSKMARLPMFHQDTLKLEGLFHKSISDPAAPGLNRGVPIFEPKGGGAAVPTPSTYCSSIM